MNIYVGNLSYSTTEDDLRALFEEYGEVTSVAIIKDKFSGQSKGFAFVEMAKDQEANTAMQALNESQMQGRKLMINEARPRTEGGPRSGGGGSRGGERRSGGGDRGRY